MASVISAIRDGQVRGLAITTGTRSPALPDIRAAQEAGVPGYGACNWHAVHAPAGTPAPVLIRLEVAALIAVRDCNFRLLNAIIKSREKGAAILGFF